MPRLLPAAAAAVLLLAAGNSPAAETGPLRLPVQAFITLPDGVRQPEGLATDPATGNIYVGTFDARTPETARNNRLLRFDRNGRLLAQKDFGPTPLTGLAVRDGQVYVLNFGAAALQRLPADFADDTQVQEVVTFAALRPPAPSARVVDNPDASQDRIRFGSTGLPGINGMVFDQAGNLFVSDSFQGAVYRIDDAVRCRPCRVRTISRDPLLGTAAALPFGANGLAFNSAQDRLYLTNAGDGRLLRLAPTGGAATVVAENVHGADGLLFHDGLLWVAANQADQVVALDERGRVRVRAGGLEGVDPDGAPRGLLFPASTAVHGDWMLVSNLALPLTAAEGDEWEEQVERWTLSRFRLPAGGTAAGTGAMDAVTRYVEAGERRFAYRELGPRGGVPLVLFNRLRGTLDDWDPAFVDRLADQRHVIAFDHAGLSRSTGTPPDSYRGFADAAAGFIRALGHDQVDVLGFSFGGTVAQRMTIDHPALVRRLVIAGSSPGFVPGDAPRNGPVPEQVWATAFKPVNDDADFLYLFFSPSPASQAAGRAYLARLRARPDAFAVPVAQAGWRAQIAAAQGVANAQSTLLHELGAIAQPTLVANGNNDIMTPTYASYAMFQALPNARLLLYPDSGHGFLFQYPDDFARQVLAFLD
jgi:pimeloyl-ACP methyl ester carboxylesterase/DNA-binding beta-propeller fold protein YncE